MHAQQTASLYSMPWPVAAERVLVEAKVDSVPALDEAGWQFDARVRVIRHPDWPSRRIRIRMARGDGSPEVGQLWQFALRIDPPRDARSHRQLLRDHLAATARVQDGPLTRQLREAPATLDGLRSRLARRISDRTADPAAASLLAALAVGVTGEVTTQQWRIFNATGITHLVAISGMHVTFFAMLSMALARRLWSRLAGLPCVPRRESFAAATGVALALLYALLSGFSVPAQRTVAMLAAFLAMRECGRRTRPAWSVSASLLAVLLFDPMAALSAGFWLSFMAVAAIVLIAGARLVPAPPLAAALHLQWLVTVALLPVTLAIFGSFSAVGILANALAIPTFTFLLVPPVLVATACYLFPSTVAGWCGDQLVDMAAFVAGLLWPALSWCAALPGALWRADVPWSWFLLAPGAVGLVLLPVPYRVRFGALGLLCSVFLLREPRPRAGQLWIDVVDVGASTAVVLRTHSRLLLWGAGETFGSEGRRFEQRILPGLRSSGYPRVELWLPGKLTRDVQAALHVAASELPVRVVLAPDARGVPPEAQPCRPRRWQWDGIAFEMQVQDGNCTLLAGNGSAWMVLGALGDASLPGASSSTIRLLPRAASSAARQATGPGQLLLASVSADEWQSPAWQRARSRLHEGGAVLLSTATDGTLRLRLDAEGIRHR